MKELDFVTKAMKVLLKKSFPGSIELRHVFFSI